MSEISTITSVSKQYESSGDCSTVSTGSGDLGGISYGSYQLSSNAGSVDSFLDFAQNYPNDALANYGRTLAQYEVNSQEFINTWEEIGQSDPDGFGELQDAYAMEVYYNPSCIKLQENYYNVSTKSIAMKACVFSRAIQYGSGNMVELFNNACQRLGYDNLSYVDDARFDYNMIASVYDFLIDECDNSYQTSNGLYHSPNDWCNGSWDVICGLRNRFINEKSQLLNML